MLHKAKRAFLTEQVIYDQDESQQYPLYPFNVDFMAKKKKQSQWQPITPPQIEEKQPMQTEIQGSEGYSQEQFDSYSSFQSLEESIAQQQILNETQQPINQRQSACSFVQPHSQDETNPYEFLSQSTLRRMNERLVALKQSFRIIARKYTHNLFILERQRVELDKLRGQKKKALDFNYELELSREQTKGRIKSLAICDSIGEVSTMMKKMRYKRVREGHLGPFDNSCLLSDSRAVDNPMAMSRLLSRREQVLCKMRQEQNNTRHLQALNLKEKDYLRMIDEDNGKLCKGDVNNLKKRIQFLKKEMHIKRDMFRLKEEEQNLDIAALRTEINGLDYKITVIDGDIRAAKMQKELKQEIGSLTKRVLVNFNRKKNSSFILRMMKPVSPISISKLSQDCTPTTHSKIQINFDQSIGSPTQLKHQKQSNYNPYRKYFRQHTTHK